MPKVSSLRMFAGPHSNALRSLSFSRPIITSAKTFSMVAQQPAGTSYTYNIQATGEPTTYSATNLPAGMSMASPASLGQIIGAPLVPGTYTVTVAATNSFGTTSTNITFTAAANSSVELPVIQNDIIWNTFGSSYLSSVVQSAGGTASVWSASNLPSGFFIDTSTGDITGTATSEGTTTVTVSATNARGTGTGQIVIVVGTFTGANLPVLQSPIGIINRNEDETSSLEFIFSNSPTSYASVGLPNGLYFGKYVNQPNAYLSQLYLGTDSSSTFIVAAINAGGVTKQTVTVNWVPVAPVLTSVSSIPGRTSTSLSYQPTATGRRIVYSATNLPSGLSISSTTGLISGTFTGAAGQTTSTISATNNGGVSTKSINFYVSGGSTLALKALVSSDGYKVGILRTDGFVDEFYRPSGSSTWTYYSNSWKVTAQSLVNICVGPVMTLGITSSGGVVGWYNIPNTTYTQATVNSAIPSSVSSGVTKVQAGPGGYSLALKSNGSLVAWVTLGEYSSSTANQLLANTPSSGPYTDISVSSSGIASAVNSNGAAVTWGTSLTTPIGALSGVASVSAGESGLLALKTDGTVISWHEFDSSWVNYDDKNPVPTLSPAGIGLTVTAIAANYTSFMLLNTVYRGTYSASTVYYPRDVVLYLSKYWIRKVEGSGQTPVVDQYMYYWHEIPSSSDIAKGSGLRPWFIRYFNTAVTPNRFEIIGTVGEEAPPASVINVSSISSGDGVYLAVHDGGKVASWGRLKTNLPF